jgi:RNA polymerase sigma-70 factor (ECF subfamily)
VERYGQGSDSLATTRDDVDSLWARHTSGDAVALGALCDGVAPVLHRRAASITRDHALAEDAVQETFLDLVRGAHGYDARRPLLPWLIGVVTRKALKARRTDRRRPDPQRLPRRATGAEPELRDDAAFAALRRFAEPYRSAALLRWRYDLSPTEVAHLRGEPAGTTRSLLSRAVSQLRRIASTLAALVAVGMGWRWVTALRRLNAAPERDPVGAVVGVTAAAGAGKGLLAVALSGLVGLGSTLLVLDRRDPAPQDVEIHTEAAAASLPNGWGWIHRHRPTVGTAESVPALPSGN